MRESGESAEETVRRITAMLDQWEQLAEDDDDLTLFQRVQGVVNGLDYWSDLAIRRLHEIHRLTDQECELCSKWLDDSPAQ